MSKKLITALLKIFFSISTRLKLYGIEKILHDQPVIVTGNHIGFLDGLLLPTIKEVASNKNLIVVIAEKYEVRPIFKWAIDSLDFMFIDRFNPDVYTVRKVLRMLKNNGLMMLAPEGTRSPNASLIEGKSGAAYFASKTGALIVPIGATGTEDSVVGNRRILFGNHELHQLLDELLPFLRQDELYDGIQQRNKHRRLHLCSTLGKC